MDFTQLKELLQLVNQSDLREFELNTEQLGVRMSKNNYRSVAQVASESGKTEQVNVGHIMDAPIEQTAKTVSSPAPAASEPEIEESGYVLEAPIVGVVYLSPSPDKPAFKKSGDAVKTGETLCIVEAMKVMNEIKSDRNGVIQEVLVEDGQAIEFGQPLFRIKEED